uniref:Uncharacterized protein n=1 Tax=Oryza glumipatula TaxID=40148 RepID=A0A0E0BV15_9ORYZ
MAGWGTSRKEVANARCMEASVDKLTLSISPPMTTGGRRYAALWPTAGGGFGADSAGSALGTTAAAASAGGGLGATAAGSAGGGLGATAEGSGGGGLGGTSSRTRWVAAWVRWQQAQTTAAWVRRRGGSARPRRGRLLQPVRLPRRTRARRRGFRRAHALRGRT